MVTIDQVTQFCPVKYKKSLQGLLGKSLLFSCKGRDDERMLLPPHFFTVPDTHVTGEWDTGNSGNEWSMSGDAVDTLEMAEPMDGKAWVLLNVDELLPHPRNDLPL